MILIEWDTEEKQLQLLNILKQDGADLPNNLFVENTVRFSIEKRYPVNCMRFFSTEFDENTSPTYVFIVEENNNGMTSIFARPPTHGQDRVLLEKALTELFDKFHKHLQNHGEMRIRSDTFTRDVLGNLALAAGFDIIQCATTALFYLNEAQMKFTKTLVWPPCAGFHVDAVDVDKDAARIHENWPQSVRLEATKPQYTLPEFRGRGLARLAEGSFGILMSKQGIRSYYLAQIQNADVFAGAKNDKYVTMWEEKAENNNEESGTVQRQDRRHFPLQNTIIKMKH